jgi:hypothetical protein
LFAGHADWAGVGAKEKGGKQDVVWPAASIKWEDGPAKGTRMAKLWGDMMKGGPYGVLVKFDAGVMHPLHFHTRDLKLVVLSGTFVHRPEGGAETKLGPGSYLLQAGGRKHISGASADGPCEFFMTSSGKFDMTMAETPSK